MTGSSVGQIPVAAGRAGELFQSPVLAFPLFTLVTEAQRRRASSQASQLQAKARELGSADSQPLASATWGLSDPSVRPSAFWKPLES